MTDASNFKWIKQRKLIDEIMPSGKDVTLEDIIPFMAEEKIQGSVPKDEAKRFFEYSRLDGESDLEFNLRKMRDAFLGFYEVPQECVISPFSINSENPAIPGFLFRVESASPNYASLVITIDFPMQLVQDQPQAFGCRFGLMSFPDRVLDRVLTPDVLKKLKKFFHVLPRTCSFQDWQKSPTSTKECLVFNSFIVAPQELFSHFAVDVVMRLLAWLKEEHLYDLQPIEGKICIFSAKPTYLK